MDIKIKKITLIVMGVLLIIVLSSKFYKTNLVDINNQNSLINNILELKGCSSIEILKEKKYDDYYMVIYKSDSKEELELIIYKKTQSILSNGYEYYGGASSSKSFDTFNGNEEGKKTTIIVYGDNRSVNAYSYSITNSEVTYKKDIDDDFILDAYVILDSDNCTSDNNLYEASGKFIDIF